MKRFSFTLALTTFAVGLTMQMRPAQAIPIPTVGMPELGNYITLLKNYAEELAKQALQGNLNKDTLKSMGSDLSMDVLKQATGNLKNAFKQVTDQVLAEVKIPSQMQKIGLTKDVLADPENTRNFIDKWSNKFETGNFTEDEVSLCRAASAKLQHELSKSTFATAMATQLETAKGESIEAATDMAKSAQDQMSTMGVSINLEQRMQQEMAKLTSMTASSLAATSTGTLCSGY